MIAIATLLELSANKKTSQTWRWLENECGLSGIKIAPMPHLSWQVAEEYDLDCLVPRLEGYVKTLRSFTAGGFGLGIFTRDVPVLYYSIAKTNTLIQIHKMLWQISSSCANKLFDVYSPDEWIPHITLAYKDVTPEKLACGVMELAFQPMVFEVLVNHLALIYINSTEFGVKQRFEFFS